MAESPVALSLSFISATLIPLLEQNGGRYHVNAGAQQLQRFFSRLLLYEGLMT